MVGPPSHCRKAGGMPLIWFPSRSIQTLASRYTLSAVPAIGQSPISRVESFPSIVFAVAVILASIKVGFSSVFFTLRNEWKTC